MFRLIAAARHLLKNSRLPLWIGGRFLLSWIAASGFMSMFATCPLCGRSGCVSGAGIYGFLIAPVLTFFSWRTRKRSKKERETPSAEWAVSDSRGISERYVESCQKEFWQEVFQVELAYLTAHLKGCRDVLSVGCGPAIIEGGLAERGFHVTGLDISKAALSCAPDSVRTVAARAEDMPFPASSFDAVIYVVSLQFVEDYRQALEKSALVLRPGGRIVVMLLNPESVFFKEKLRDSDSYIRKIRYANIRDIEKTMTEDFQVRAEYFMGVKQGRLFESRDSDYAVLYAISGTKLPIDAGKESR